MFANRFTVVLDACVLAGVLKRNIILSLAEAELFRPRWSARILNETQAAIEKMEKRKKRDKPQNRAQRARTQIELAFEDARINGFEHLESGFPELPDKDDAHVIAVAIKTKASIIVTDNLKDFPSHILAPLEIEAKSADDFIADTFDLSLPKSLAAVKKMRERFRRPEITIEQLLIRMDEVGLPQAADIMRDHIELLD